jgi:hypothetical protein
LQIGDPLRTVHPSSIHSDQVVLVPSLFGSDLSTTTFWDLRGELEPVLKEKYNNNNNNNNTGGSAGKNRTIERWCLDGVKGGAILVAPTFGAAPDDAGSMKATTTASTAAAMAAASTHGPGNSAGANAAANANANEDDDDSKNDEDEDAAGASLPNGGVRGCAPVASDSSSRSAVSAVATNEVVRRLCEYFSIDPRTATVNAGIRFGTPAVRTRPAHSYVCRWVCACRRPGIPPRRGTLFALTGRWMFFAFPRLQIEGGRSTGTTASWYRYSGRPDGSSWSKEEAAAAAEAHRPRSRCRSPTIPPWPSCGT